MKSSTFKILLGSLLLTTISACNKKENSAAYDQSFINQTANAEMSDSISSAATVQIKDKQFIKLANVNMDVKDVYDATISIEKSLRDLGGYVTSSHLNSQIVSEETYNTSDENATMVRKFQTENTIQARVPSSKLGEFLTFINDKKLFLNTRNITASDVTANIKLAELEAERNSKTATNIAQLKTDKTKVNMANDNASESNYQKVSSFEISDQIKYSTVDIYLKEPNLRVAEIAVTNIKNIDNKYKFNFFFDLKNGFIEGFYLIQKLIVGLVTIWPLLLIGVIIMYFIKRRNTLVANSKSENISK